MNDNIQISIYSSYIYLDADERRLFAQNEFTHDDITVTEQEPINKQLTNEIQCIISYEPILSGTLYWECAQCRSVCSGDCIRAWFVQSKTCPVCRKSYSFTQLYKNCQ